MLAAVIRLEHAGFDELLPHLHAAGEAVAAYRARLERMEGKDAVGAADVAVPVAAEVEPSDMLVARAVTAEARAATDFDEAGVVVHGHDVKASLRGRRVRPRAVAADAPRLVQTRGKGRGREQLLDERVVAGRRERIHAGPLREDPPPRLLI